MKKLLLVIFLLINSLLFGQSHDENFKYVNGFLKVSQNQKISFVNQHSGKLITNYSFDDARNFNHHFAAVEINGKWGFIDESGNLVIPADYDVVYDFQNENTVVLKNNKWELINDKGNTIKELDIDVFLGFEHNNGKIIKDGVSGILDNSGNITLNTKNKPSVSNKLNNNNSNRNIGANDCPNNLDFENSNFNNWRCYTGTVDTIGNTNRITVVPSLPIANRHKIIAKTAPAVLDQYGLFSTNPPDGSNYGVKLGNKNNGAEAERIAYTINVPANDTNFSIRYDYAVVFQDPGHTSCSQPRFNARLFDSATNNYIDCASYEYIATSNLPGFAVSTIDPTVIYKPWSSVYINLKAYAGHTIYLEFTTADCARRAHWGYAYIDIESSCRQNIGVRYDCNMPDSILVDGPSGFQNYNWWNENYTQLLSTQQHAHIHPNNTDSNLIHLEMIPYNAFGCRDTLTMKLSGNVLPSFHSLRSTSYCNPNKFTFFNHNLPSVITSWNFGDGTNAVGDTVIHNYLSNGTYVVTMMTTLPSGCASIKTDTIIISSNIDQPTISFQTGIHCGGENIQFSSNISNADSLVWNFGDGNTVNTNTSSVSHSYTQAGTFLISATGYYSDGCIIHLDGIDTIKIEKIMNSFVYTKTSNCNNVKVQFENQSSSFFGIQNITWDFGDGVSSNELNPIHFYNSNGSYQVSCIVYGVNGCSNSFTQTIDVNLLSSPIFTITGPNEVCKNSIVNFNAVFSSSDSTTNLTWDAIQGATSIGNSNTVLFNQAANYIISATATSALGCVTHSSISVLVNPLPVVTANNDFHACKGTQYTLTAQGAIQYIWTNTNLNCNNCSNPNFTANDDDVFIVEGVNQFGCRNSDTIFVSVVKPFQIQVSDNDTICKGGSVQLNASNADNYRWYPVEGLNNANLASPIASPRISTNYQVIGYDNYHCFSDTNYVYVDIKKQPRLNVASIVNAEKGSVITLNPNIEENGMSDFQWIPATNLSCDYCLHPSLQVSENIDYTLLMKNEQGCEFEHTITINAKDKKSTLFLPNTFSPNGDGMNDVFMARGNSTSIKTFKVISRNGVVIFEKHNINANNQNDGWNGLINGLKALADVYLYYIEAIENDNKLKVYKGNVSLLR